jgi:hypothetical protein
LLGRLFDYSRRTSTKSKQRSVEREGESRKQRLGKVVPRLIAVASSGKHRSELPLLLVKAKR